MAPSRHSSPGRRLVPALPSPVGERVSIGLARFLDRHYPMTFINSSAARAGGRPIYSRTPQAAQGSTAPTARPGIPPARHPESVIVAVDDQPANLTILERMLKRAGYSNIHVTSDSRETALLVHRLRPDLLLLDWHMPHLDGLGVLDELAPYLARDGYLPVVILSADATSEARQQALSRGASDFVMKPFDAAEVILRTGNLLEMRRLHLDLRARNEELEDRLGRRTRALEEAHAGTLERLARAVEYRDDQTGQHTQRVGELSARIASRMALGSETVSLLRRAAPLHDVGKIGIPDAVLNKPGPLTADEFALMTTHTVMGAQLLADGHSAITEMAERIARSHHERWDGTGYPDRLSGDDIPLEARIVAVADFYDALTSDRPYRAAWSAERTVDALREARGSHFDPAVVDAFLDVLHPQG